ncbi:alpha/beta fold hydrolase [Spirochaeta dissipatitropha]
MRAAKVSGIFCLIIIISLITACASSLRGSLNNPRLLADSSSRFLELDSILVHYTDSAHGLTTADYPVLMLLHGFGGNTSNFDAVIGELSGLFRVIAFDRPPFGYSQKALPADYGEHSPYSRTQQAEYAVQLMDALGISSAVLVGHSAGGAVALQTAIRHPDRIEGLLLVSPAVQGGGSPAFVRRLFSIPPFRWLGPFIVRRTLAGSERILARSFYDSAVITEDIRQQYRRGSEIKDWDKALWQFSIEAESSGDSLDYTKISVPVLIISGAEDEIVDPEQSILLHGKLSDSELYLMEKIGHIAFQEDPEGFLEIVRPWLTDRYLNR